MTGPSRAMRALEVALFAGALLVAGLVISAIAWSGTAAYEQMARANGVSSVEMSSHGPGGDVAVQVPLSGLVELHQQWSSFVIGGQALPTAFGRDLWTDDERAHMKDVQGVFELAKFAIPVSLLVIVIRLQRARIRGPHQMWQLVRDGAVWSVGIVALIGLVALIAFEPLFLAFHYVFFPQGNFLFPSTSNLIRLYPDWYWEGITLRVGLSFIAVALALAGLAQLRMRAAK
jgi:integral membrane protein (TIGR01906 family)